MEYSAGLTSKLFWLQESRKTAGYILEGLSKADIRKIAWEENIYQVKAEYRAYEVLNGTFRRVSALQEAVLQTFITCDVETAKILNLIAILMGYLLGPLLETYLRTAMIADQGNLLAFTQHPIALGLIVAAVIVLAGQAFFRKSRRKKLLR